jgi:exopolysaccharide production protein ExoQ
MLPKNYQKISDELLIFILFFLSNALAFIHVVWLVPEIVLLDAVVLFMLASFFIWTMNKNNLLSSFFESLKRNWIILPFLIFSGCSIFWSVYWEVSLYRWLILLFTISTGAYIGLRYNIREIVKLLSIFGVYILFLSSILVFFMPDLGVMNYYIIQGAWKGLYWHKNHMGLIAVFINILFLINIIYSLQSKEKGIISWGSLYLFSLLFIYQTDSVAAYMTTIFLHGVILLALILLKFGGKFRRPHYLIFSLVLLFASLILYFNIGRFFSVFNRSTSLTGRIPMWNYLFDAYFSKRPLFGYGFNAFWYIDSHQAAIQQVAGYPDPVIIADNGFIDILVNTGYVGFVFFLIFYFGLWWSSFQYARKAKDINEIFPVILMSYTLLANISWSLIFENESFFMLIMISVLFSISASSTVKHAAYEPTATYP